jgi:hypothetical protein
MKSCKGLPSFLLGFTSMKEYEERAVKLALNQEKLQALTNKLKEVRMTCPLFDTARWVSSPGQCQHLSNSPESLNIFHLSVKF